MEALPDITAQGSPKAFATKAGSGLRWRCSNGNRMRFPRKCQSRRREAGCESRSARRRPGPEGDALSKADVEAIQGNWAMASCQRDGQVFPNSSCRWAAGSPRIMKRPYRSARRSI